MSGLDTSYVPVQKAENEQRVMTGYKISRPPSSREALPPKALQLPAIVISTGKQGVKYMSLLVVFFIQTILLQGRGSIPALSFMPYLALFCSKAE